MSILKAGVCALMMIGSHISYGSEPVDFSCKFTGNGPTMIFKDPYADGAVIQRKKLSLDLTATAPTKLLALHQLRNDACAIVLAKSREYFAFQNRVDCTAYFIDTDDAAKRDSTLQIETSTHRKLSWWKVEQVDLHNKMAFDLFFAANATCERRIARK